MRHIVEQLEVVSFRRPAVGVDVESEAEAPVGEEQKH